MTIAETIRQGFYYARTCKSLWIFGFFAGTASGGSNGGGGGAGNADGGKGAFAAFLSNLSLTEIVGIGIAGVLAIGTFVVLRLIAEGAMIEGIVRVREGRSMTAAEGFRAGWEHWGVLARIALMYFAAMIGSLALLAGPWVIALHALGPIGGVLAGIPALLIAVPWLVTLYLVQAFASRIAVLENRDALDAIGKARLFLHGRLVHALRLLAAALAGSVAIVLVGIGAMTAVALSLVALIPALRVLPVLVLACLVLLPAVYLFAAVLGIFRSSIWTIGYVTQVES